MTFLLAVASLIAACGGGPSQEERIRQAFEDLRQGVRDRSVATVCGKTFLSTDLPPRVARSLGVPGGSPGTQSSWDRHHRECLRDFGKHGEFDRRAGRITVDDVSVGPRVVGADGISRTAMAHVKGASVRAAMVEFRGDWKLVLEVG